MWCETDGGVKVNKGTWSFDIGILKYLHVTDRNKSMSTSKVCKELSATGEIIFVYNLPTKPHCKRLELSLWSYTCDTVIVVIDVYGYWEPKYLKNECTKNSLALCQIF